MRFSTTIARGDEISSKATRFETLLEAVPDALVGMDQKGVIRFVNRQTEFLFGFDRDQLIGEPVEKLVPEPLWQIYAQHRDEYFADPRTRSSALELELSGRHRDGGDFPINVSMAHIDTGDVLLVITAVGDVTQQKLAARHAQRLAEIVEYADDAISASTLEGIITVWNPAAERMYGYSGRETIGRSALLLAPEDRPREMAAVLARIKKGRVVDFETTLTRKDGTPVAVSLTISAIRDEGGAVVGVAAIHRDVTEQRRAFEAAQRLAAIVESSDDSIISSTPDRIVTTWNPAAERMYGYSGEEVIGRSIDVLISEDRADEMRAVSARIRAGEHVDYFETTRVRKDGTVLPISLTLSPIRDATGTVVGVSAIGRDMTKLKQAERALAETSRRYQLLAENASDLVVLSSPQREIVWLSPSLTRTLGWTVEDLMGTRLFDLMHPEDQAAMAPKRETLFSAQEITPPPDGFLMRVRTKSGQYRWMSGLATPAKDDSGALMGVVAGLRDVDDLVRAREAAQRMAAIIESSDDAVVSATLDGTITSWNPAAERIFGYPAAEMLGRTSAPLIPADRADETKDLLAKVRAGQLVHHLETMRIRKDGKVFRVSVTVSPIRDAKGAVVGVSGITRDVTEQRQAFDAAQRMAAVVEHSDEAILSLTLDGTITSWNPAAEKMSGYSSEEVIGSSCDFIVPDDRPGEVKALLAEIKTGAHVKDFETERVRKDGSRLPISLTLSPIPDVHGAVVGASLIARDLTPSSHHDSDTR